jgi:hypothetical protein
MNVLIGFEESQAVCKEFRKLGFNAFSCDLKPCSGGYPEWHLQMDIYKALELMKWDFIGLHPVCTKITLSGNRHYAPSKEKHNERIEAIEWTINIFKHACKLSNYVYMENPMGAMNSDSRLPKPQIVQPYYFGDPFTKTTCLWLHGLKPLKHFDKVDLFNSEVTHVETSKEYKEWQCKKTGKMKRQQMWYYNALLDTKSGCERSEVRSKTFPGMAKAMAAQWAKQINP